MKLYTLAWSSLVMCSLVISSVQAELKQPLSVQPIGFNYNNFQDAAEAVPEAVTDAVSDVAPVAADPAEASAPASPAPEAHSTPAEVAPVQAAPAQAAPYYQAPPAMPAPSCSTCAPAAPSCVSCAPACCPPAHSCEHSCALGICDCDLGDAWTLSGALHGDCEPVVTVGGWLQAGYHSYNTGMFNSLPDRVNLHQAWLYAEKAATCDSPIGFRADFMYGVDADDTQAFGNNPGEWDFQNGFDRGAGYGWAIPQLYAEVALTENWSVKAGHFYTLLGYEVVTAPDNFFYSHAYTMYNSEAFTHTGVLATGTISDSLTVYAGWTLGWDTGFDQFGDGSSWLGGFSYSICDDATLTFISTAGNFGALAPADDNAYSHSVVLDVAVTDDFNYVFQSDTIRAGVYDTFGINQYFLYSVSDCLGLGARAEWWKADGISQYAATFGANIRPHANFILRPEYRVDWNPASNTDFDGFGIDAIFTF